jgi:hypothetical protein
VAKVPREDNGPEEPEETESTPPEQPASDNGLPEEEKDIVENNNKEGNEDA